MDMNHYPVNSMNTFKFLPLYIDNFEGDISWQSIDYSQLPSTDDSDTSRNSIISANEIPSPILPLDNPSENETNVALTTIVANSLQSDESIGILNKPIKESNKKVAKNLKLLFDECSPGSSKSKQKIVIEKSTNFIETPKQSEKIQRTVKKRKQITEMDAKKIISSISPDKKIESKSTKMIENKTKKNETKENETKEKENTEKKVTRYKRREKQTTEKKIKENQRSEKKVIEKKTREKEAMESKTPEKTILEENGIKKKETKEKKQAIKTQEKNKYNKRSTNKAIRKESKKELKTEKVISTSKTVKKDKSNSSELKGELNKEQSRRRKNDFEEKNDTQKLLPKTDRVLRSQSKKC